MEKGNEVAAVFFDLTKAFDSVPHRSLINKLETTGLDEHLIKWIINYLTDRWQSAALKLIVKPRNLYQSYLECLKNQSYRSTALSPLH